MEEEIQESLILQGKIWRIVEMTVYIRGFFHVFFEMTAWGDIHTSSQNLG
jgi:hypothetical protein